MDETSSGYSSKGEGHPCGKGAQRGHSHSAPFVRDTKGFAASRGGERVTGSQIDSKGDSDSDPLSNESDNQVVVLKHENKTDVAHLPRASAANELILQLSSQHSDKNTSLYDSKTSTDHNFKKLPGKILPNSNIWAVDGDIVDLIDAVLDDNMALQRQLISSQQFFYRLIDDLKSRLIEAEGYTQMVKQQLKENTKKLNRCTCQATLEPGRALSEVDKELPQEIRSSCSLVRIESTKKKSAIASTEASSSTMPKLSGLHSDKGKSQASTHASSSLHSGSAEVKQDLRERNKQLQQQISFLKERNSDTSSRASSGEKETPVMPNIVSSSYFTAATHSKGLRYHSPRTRKEHIAVEEVRWVKKPPATPKKKSIAVKACLSQNGAFRTINVQSWASDVTQR